MREYDTNIVCRILQVSKSGYYSHKVESVSEKTAVEKTVINCFKKHNRNYGRIRIRKEVLNEGIDISEYRIAKILKKYGMRIKFSPAKNPYVTYKLKNINDILKEIKEFLGYI